MMRDVTPVIVALALALTVLGTAACGEKNPTAPPEDVAEDVAEDVVVVDDVVILGEIIPEFAEQEVVGPASGVDDPAAETGVQAAASRRLSIDQIEGSIPVLTGRDDLIWRFVYNGTDYPGFDVLGVTLGRPDYYQLTDENREPSALYIKLIGDMSADVCTKIIGADLERADPAERTFLRHAELGTADEALIRENLRYLTLFYLGEYVTDDAGVDGLAAVYEIAHTEAVEAGVVANRASGEAWLAVCMALLATPNFHIY